MTNPANWLLGFTSSFIAGVAIESLFKASGLYIFFLNCALISSVIFFIYIKKHKKIGLFLGFLTIIFVGSSFGIFRTEKSIFPTDSLKKFRDNQKTVTVIGTIIKEPDIRNTHTKYTLLIEPINERILVSTKLFPEYYYNDKIKLTGKLENPTEFPDFNYREFLIKDKIHTVSSFPIIELVKKSNFSFYQKVLDVKDTLRRSTSNILPYPYSEILMAMMLGDTRTLPQFVKDIYNSVGLSHILAISGGHITIIGGILILILKRTRFKKNSFYIVMGILFFYIVLIGYPPSAVRAGIMAGILLLGDKIKRPYTIERGLIVTAFVMLVINPLFLKYDIGFQLSFLAVLGITHAQNLFQLFFKKRMGDKIKWLQDALSVTLSAQIYTLPIIIYNFGVFPLFSPLVNILVVPLLTFLTILSFIAIMVGVISGFLGTILSFPIYLILVYIQKISIFFGTLPLNSIKIDSINFFWIIIIYLIIGLQVRYLRKKYLPN